ncbi:DNA (cytosine-5-)-methyltransferase [uncultured Leptotrichia sp.]|jgi:DNA (cytosine-5-)-methyltransferase|uniref:DNA (cytosine-5-)-methyltransferase n=1 Tax=uncultured Leptotrichia sp. TaxID=159271 RepID=UPI00260A9E4D|nr:DNA (cytosine-5-)-methyltransferase [uncultured Leptotrichia sp.]
MRKIKVIELFAGVGSQAMALRNIGIDYEVIGISEIDKFACKSYEAIHGKVKNFGDITKIDKLPYCDLLTYSFPCQDLSIAGHRKGISKDTRSGLLLEVERLLLKAKEDGTLPKYLLLENVKNLVGKKFIKDFERWLNFLNSLGYYSNREVLNAKDYGIPQNRERVFVVSSLENMHYKFPKAVELKSKMKDLLEEKVDEKYYLSEKHLKCFSDMKNRNGFIRGERFNPRKLEECNTAFAITTRVGARPTDNFIIQKGHGFNKGGIKENIVPALTKSSWHENNFVVNINPSGRGMNGNVYNTDLSPTLTTNKGEGIKILQNNDYRIRKLTPLECWRLMGFRDMDYYAAKSVGISDAQLYKQAGNSIVVTVLEAIFRNLFFKKHRRKQGIVAEQIRIF